jgi:uncharacterized protein YodC (DUF2158 family)
MLMLKKQAAIAVACALGLNAVWAGGALCDQSESSVAIRNHAPSLQSGDLVRLRSGGPLMIVKSVQDDQAVCSWWSVDEDYYRTDTFPVAMLTGPVTIAPTSDDD